MNEDVKERILKKCFNGSKSGYWDILNITTYLFYYYSFRTEETFKYTKHCLWFYNAYREYLNNMTYDKLYKKIRDIL